MTSAQVVETSVNVIINSPSQDYTHPDDHTLLTYDKTPRFKPFTVIVLEGNRLQFEIAGKITRVQDSSNLLYMDNVR